MLEVRFENIEYPIANNEYCLPKIEHKTKSNTFLARFTSHYSLLTDHSSLLTDKKTTHSTYKNAQQSPSILGVL